MVQTHVSWIFLTDGHAYKVKKPVDFGFLNFSTIDRRRFYCNEEIKYNSRLCPDIYEGVVELREAPDGAAFHGNGAVLDYAVKMKRLPAEGMLDRLVTERRATAADLRDVARVIAEFHRTAETSPGISQYGHLERILSNWQENFDQAAPLESTTLPASEREFIRDWVVSFAREHAEAFDQRVKGGFIRECDGDIHLENICLTEGRIYIFDCIEFNERFRCCDTASDMAFLLMDLDFHGRHDLAEETAAAYLEASGDSGMPGVIEFYKVYRAFIRGKVESFRLNDAGPDLQERERIISKAARYFRLARGYIERHTLLPTLFITCGLMGSGKSTLAAQLFFELGIPVFRSDAIRKQMAGIPVDEPAPAGYGHGLYEKDTTRATYNELARRAEEELAMGRSAVIDASFISRDHRLEFAALAERYRARFVVLHVSCSETETRRRLVARAASGRSVSDGRFELLPSQRERFEPPLANEGLVIPLHTGTSPASLTSQIYKRLRIA
ncbi:kinase [Geobacter sp. SVR]|nr:kinase [Geobacter sp. SVR]